jgi:hypothetical protein
MIVLITERGGVVRRSEFSAPVISVGRLPGSDLVLPDARISKRHLKLVGYGALAMAVDTQSTNGTYLDGRMLAAPAVLRSGDKVYVEGYALEVEGCRYQPPEACRAMARSPDLPLEVLYALAALYPRDFLTNPLLGLLLLEEPGFYGGLPSEALAGLLSLSEAPRGVLEACARHSERRLRQKVARHPAAPPDIIASLAADRDLHVRQAAVERLDTLT